MIRRAPVEHSAYTTRYKKYGKSPCQNGFRMLSYGPQHAAKLGGKKSHSKILVGWGYLTEMQIMLK